MKNFVNILILVLFCQIHLISQEENIAEIDGEILNKVEFVKRFELTPRITSSTDIDSQKVHFLYTLLAEKLWAKEALNLRLDTTYSYQQYISNLEKQLVRDALFKLEVENKVSITETKVEQVLQKSKYELRFNFLFSTSENEIDSLFSLLSKVNIDSVLLKRPERLEQPEPIPVLFGQMDEILEDTLFQLQAGEFTNPINTGMGWVIYFLKEKIELSGLQLGSRDNLLAEISKTITDREKQKLMNSYLNNLLKGKIVNTDGELFESLSQKLSDALIKKYIGQEYKSYILYEDDISRIITSLPSETQSSILIKFSVNPVNLKEFLHYLLFTNFKSTNTDLNSVQLSLNSAIREFIRNEFVARDGYEQNLNLLPEIQSELKMWKDNYLSQLLRNSFNKKIEISDTELNNHISLLEDSVITTKFIDITEVKLTNLDQAQFLLTQISIGRDFDDVLARMNLPQQSIIKSDSLQPISSLGSLIEIVDNMEKNEIYGPIVKAEGYSIIKLNKVEIKDLSAVEKNKLQIELQRELIYFKKLYRELTEKTIELAEKYNLTVDESKLSGIKVTEIPALIYRLYGFGGQSVAAPFTNLFYEWYFQYKSEAQSPL